MSSTCLTLCLKFVVFQHFWQKVFKILEEWWGVVSEGSSGCCFRAAFALLGWSSHRLACFWEMMIGSLLRQVIVGQHACVGRPSLSRKVSHAIVLLVCFHGPAVMRRLRSTREVVSQVFESLSSSAVSVRSGSRIDSTRISRGSVTSAVQVIRSLVTRVPVLCVSCLLWKALDRVRARALSSGTAVECVHVQLNECVDRRSSCGLVGSCGGPLLAMSSADVSIFFVQSVRWAVCYVLLTWILACGQRVLRAFSLCPRLWCTVSWLETQSRPFAAG